MSGGYSAFAYFYDALTGNISYKERADYFDRLIKKHGGQKGVLLDLACGTGSLSEEMSRLGYDVIGVDGSVDMLSEAMNKKIESGLDIQYICQDMTELDLYGDVDVTVCALDSLNHLSTAEDIEKAIASVSLFTEIGGLFIFDVNTPYKHEHILGNNTFVYDVDEVYCVWQNSFLGGSDNKVEITLDFFENQDGSYQRYGEEFAEIALSRETIEKMLSDHGMEAAACYNYDTEDQPSETSEKLVFVAKKIK